MTNVTISVEDLESLVQQAGLTPHIRNMVTAHSNDAAVRRTMGNANDAIYRANRLVADARRITDPASLEPLTDSAAGLLLNIKAFPYDPELGGHFWDPANQHSGLDMRSPVTDELKIKGCIQLCNLAIVALWKDAERRSVDRRMMIRLTPRGERECGDPGEPRLLRSAGA